MSTSTTGQRLAVSEMGQAGCTPEDLGKQISKRLLLEIQTSGYLDRNLAWFPLVWMALTPPDVSKIRFGPLPPFAIQTLRELRRFLNVTFRLRQEEAVDDEGMDIPASVTLSVIGIGFHNLNRKQQ